MQTPNQLTASIGIRLDSQGKAAHPQQQHSSSTHVNDRTNATTSMKSAFSGELRLHMEKALSSRLGRVTDKAAEAQRRSGMSLVMVHGVRGDIMLNAV